MDLGVPGLPHTLTAMSDVSGNSAEQRTISRGIVAIYKDFLGRGPTSATTTITDSFVTTVCRDSLTRAEQRLIERGDQELVRDMRRRFQSAMSDEMIKLVEETTGRRATGFLSDHDVDQDVAIETILLEES